MRTSNILDPIEKDLDPNVYRGIDPRSSIVNFIEKLYYRALDHEFGVEGDQWADLYLTGSLTTYQFSETSDCDVSVFPNYDLFYKKLGLDSHETRKRLISMSIDHLDGTFLPGTTHPIQYFVVPPGTLPTDLYQPGLRSAYSFNDRTWLVKPEKNRVHDVSVEYPELFARAAALADKFTTVLDGHDYKAAEQMWQDIHKKRQLDQRAGLGDFCEGNIVYKWFLHQGLFDRIRNELHEYIAKIGRLDLTDEQASDDLLFSLLRTMRGTKDIHDPAFEEFVVKFLTSINEVSSEEAHEIVQQFIARQDAERERRRVQQEYAQQQMLEDRKQYDQEFAVMEAKYGDRAREIFHRFDNLKPADAPNFAGGLEDITNYMVTDGWEWKFILELGLGAFVWADAETHDYNGVYPHTYAMMDLKNISDVPLVKANMAGGWITKGPLEEGDTPYEIRMLSGQDLTDDQILETLGLSPQEAEVDRIDRPLRMEEHIATDDQRLLDLADQVMRQPKREPSWTPSIPDAVMQQAIYKHRCPICGGYLQDRGDVYTCQSCPFEYDNRGKITANLWEDRVSQKVIYDFDNDKITLGTQATLADLPNSKIIGNYDDGIVTLFDVEKQWINPTYFRRLWHFSYPDKTLDDVYYERGDDRIKLKTIRKRRSNWKLGASSDFVDFFDQASRGQYAPNHALDPTFDDPDHQRFHNTYKQFAGNFDQHIETSIPGYRELQTKKGTAITNAFPNATVLDIGGGSGSWAKAVSQIGGNRTVNLEPNAAMVEHYWQNPVQNAEIVPHAFGEGFEHDGIQYPKFEPQETYDVINESMTFQFISNDRPNQLAEVKRLLTPGGLFLTDEKVITDNWEENERTKDNWKRQFYDDQQLQEKQQVVNVQDETSAVGMVSNMVSQHDLETTLQSNFAVVHQYWASGNFVGYACSDNHDTVNAFIEAYHGSPVQAVA